MPQVKEREAAALVMGNYITNLLKVAKQQARGVFWSFFVLFGFCCWFFLWWFEAWIFCSLLYFVRVFFWGFFICLFICGVLCLLVLCETLPVSNIFSTNYSVPLSLLFFPLWCSSTVFVTAEHCLLAEIH